jgi:hypothetical protein
MRDIAIQLLPDWTPSSVDERLVRLDALVKVPSAGVLADTPLDLLFTDDDERVVAVEQVPAHLAQGRPLVGPAWVVIPSGLLKMSAGSTRAHARVGSVRSASVARRDGALPVLLDAVPLQVGVAGEPHLWWRFYNRSPTPVPVDRIFATTTVQIDERTFSRPVGPYNGPAQLPPKRAISGLWSLDDFDARLRQGQHRFHLTILGDASAPVVFAWSPIA